MGIRRMAAEKRWVSQQCQSLTCERWCHSSSCWLLFVCFAKWYFTLEVPRSWVTLLLLLLLLFWSRPFSDATADLSKKLQRFFGGYIPTITHHTPPPELGIHKPSITWIPLCCVFFFPSTSCTYWISCRGQRGWHLCVLMMIWSRSVLTHIRTPDPYPQRSVVFADGHCHPHGPTHA